MSDQQRTIQQNKCLHQYFGELAEAFNDGGFSVQEVIKLPISHTPENIKVNIGHRIMMALFPDLIRDDGKISTKDLSTTQIQKLYENINRATAEYGISLSWPDHHNGGKC
jgi:hypothetical protein